MPRKTTPTNLVVKSFGLLDMHLEMLSRLAEKNGYLSTSEAVRNAIINEHKRAFPDYIFNRTAKDIEKRKELAMKEELDTITDEEFVKKYFPGAPIITANDGKVYFLVHWWGNVVEPKLVCEARALVTKLPDLPSSHADFLKSRGPVIGFLDQNDKDSFLNTYGMVV
jgi:hypothetical protein